MSTAEVPPDGELGPPGDPESVARTICLRQLDQRARTRAELAATLARRGVPDDAARSVLDRLTEVGLIDDGALAESYALAVQRGRGLAARAVAMKLRQRGIDEPIVQSAVGQIDADSEAAAARSLVARRLPSLRGLDPQAQARRLVALLARRGYPPGLSHQIVRDSLSQAEIGDPAELDD
ncbi:MAG: regulatory protein RecX [Pseudonocardiales bacterium]